MDTEKYYPIEGLQDFRFPRRVDGTIKGMELKTSPSFDPTALKLIEACSWESGVNPDQIRAELAAKAPSLHLSSERGFKLVLPTDQNPKKSRVQLVHEIIRSVHPDSYDFVIDERTLAPDKLLMSEVVIFSGCIRVSTLQVRRIVQEAQRLVREFGAVYDMRDFVDYCITGKTITVE